MKCLMSNYRAETLFKSGVVMFLSLQPGLVTLDPAALQKICINQKLQLSARCAHYHTGSMPLSMKMAGYAHCMHQTAALIRGYTRTDGQGKNIMPTPLGGGGIISW